MEYASKVQKGTIFEHRDRNGKVWYATVTKRTPCFVYVSIKNPYDGSVEDYGDRVQINQKTIAVPKTRVSWWGDEYESTDYEPIDDYYIVVHRYINHQHINLVFEIAENRGKSAA